MPPYDGDVGEVLSLLACRRCRSVMYCLLANDHTTRKSLALQLAAWEADVDVSSVTEDAYDAVKVALHHKHLPRLEEHDVVEFDERNGDVVRAEGFEDVRPVVERVKAFDEDLECGDHPLQTCPTA